MPQHDPQTHNPESPLTRDATPRGDEGEDAGELVKDRFAASILDLPASQSTGGTRRFYEF